MATADGVLSALSADTWQAAAGRAALGSAATMALRGDWNWREVMISAVGAGLGSAIGSYVGNPSSLGTKLVAGLASGVAVTALMGGNRRNYESVFASTLGSALGEGLSDTIRDSSLPDNVRGMPKNVRDAAHNLIAKSRMDMSSASDRADLSDWARMYGQGEILGTDRREEMGVNHLRRMNLSDDQIADIRNRWADEGLIRAPEQAGQSLTTSLDDDQAVKRLPTQYLSGRRANTALGLQELDGMATGAGSLVRRTEEFIQGNDYLKYGIEGLSFVAAPLGYLANAAIAHSPVGQAIEAKLGELHESIANRFADAGWGVQDSVDGGTGVMTVGSLAAGFGATKTIALASGVAGIVRPRVVDRIGNVEGLAGTAEKAAAAQELASALRYRALGWNHEQGKFSVIETMAISRAEKTFGKTFQPSSIEGVDIIDPSGWGNVSLKGPFLNRDLQPLTDAQQMKAVSNVAKHIQQNTAVDTHILDTTGMSKAAEEALKQAVRNSNQRIIFMRGD